MLNSVIKFALHQRAVILCAALAILVMGSLSVRSLPIDVLPDLTRPRVTVITECPGMAPEEVEREVTIPVETAVNGAAGVAFIRSASDVGLSVVTVEFDWGSEIYQARQVVMERVSMVTDDLPSDVQPELGPVSSLLGQIMIVGMWSESDDPEQATDPLELRTLGDWVVKRRLQNIPGISQVISMGGGKKQYHVLVDIHQLHKYEVTLSDIEDALNESNLNVNGGYVDQDSREFLVRGLGRMNDPNDLKKIVVRSNSARAVLLGNIAEIKPAAQAKRGDASVNGEPAVVLTIQKQPAADTRAISDQVLQAIEELRPNLPDDVRIEATYQQREFIEHSVGNVIEALRDGSILVVIILFLFLFNFRTTIITLTAIPVSILVTAFVFQLFGLSINVMTLGGIAVALGELVDDAIVDVENIFRRLRENAAKPEEERESVLKIVFTASLEVRNAIIISTILVIVVFAPLFALTGLSGRLFIPLGVAYIVSILASTIVSLTLTPVLSYYLLGSTNSKAESGQAKESWFVRTLHLFVEPFIRSSLDRNRLYIRLVVSALAIGLCGLYTYQSGKNFLPRFNEGATQLNLFSVPGTALSTSTAISEQANEKLIDLLQTEANPLGPISHFTCRTGRAENDEHVMGVNVSEYVISLNPDSGLTQREVEDILKEVAKTFPSVGHEAEQPIAHLISHMISGVTAQIAIKLFGDDLDILARKGAEIKAAISDIPGIKSPVVEQQTIIPQLRIEPDYDQLAKYKLTASQVFELVETAMQGKVVSQIYEQERVFEIVIRFPEEYRTDFAALERIPLELPGGGTIPLSTVAKVYTYGGPTTINREDARRRIVIRVNTDETDLETAVSEIEQRIQDNVELPPGYFVRLGGEFEAQRSASQRILLLSLVALVVVIVVLHSAFQSLNIVFQILFSIPVAFVGGVIALHLTDQVLNVAAMVGFVSLGGIAARNGLLLAGTYLRLAEEGPITKEVIVRGSLDRMTPVLMTTLTTGIGLIPLIVFGHLPGREILFPVATVIVGGLITSTICEFLIRPGLFYHFQKNRG